MSSPENVKETILDLEKQRYAAVIRGDFQHFADLAHPDLVYAHSNGVVDTLQSYLDKCKEGFYVYHQIEHPVASIRVLGDTVLVIGEMNAEITAGGVRKTLRNKSIAVWTRRGNAWELYAYQPTPLT